MERERVMDLLVRLRLSRVLWVLAIVGFAAAFAGSWFIPNGQAGWSTLVYFGGVFFGMFVIAATWAKSIEKEHRA